MWLSNAGESKNVHSQVELNDSDEQEAPIISGATDNVLAESIDTKTLEKEYFYFRSSKQAKIVQKKITKQTFLSREHFLIQKMRSSNKAVKGR